MKNPCTVLVSILNWNTSELTGSCVASLRKMSIDSRVRLELVVIDNGSADADWARLQILLKESDVELIRNERNVGFAAGHNQAVRIGFERDTDFIWLVNSDSLLEAGTLTAMLTVMEADHGCGAVSPVVRGLEHRDEIDFCGAYHDWAQLHAPRARTVEEAIQMEQNAPMDMWLAGTLVMFRVTALRQVGGLNEKLFAYYEDDDIGVRLARAGWRNRMAFESSALHARPAVTQRPPHYFYLMYRNAFLFYVEHTPRGYRRWMRLRLADRALFTANRMDRRGLERCSTACLLGLLDGWKGIGGPPDLDRDSPLLLRLLCKILLIKHRRWLSKVE